MYSLVSHNASANQMKMKSKHRPALFLFRTSLLLCPFQSHPSLPSSVFHQHHTVPPALHLQTLDTKTFSHFRIIRTVVLFLLRWRLTRAAGTEEILDCNGQSPGSPIEALRPWPPLATPSSHSPLSPPSSSASCLRLGNAGRPLLA